MIRKYNHFILNEMSINDESVKKYKNVLQNLPDYKNTSIYINELILKLKDSISNDSFEIKRYDEDFKNQYNSIILKSAILNPILKHEINQDPYQN